VLAKPLQLDAHIAWTLLPARVTRKARPYDAVGDFEAEGQVLAAGASMTVAF
jgi:hypothetical protein